MEYDKNLEQHLPVLQLAEVHQTKEPNNPYVYRVFKD